MIKVKITMPFEKWPLLSQTHESSGVWGDCQFFVNTDVGECDYWVVCDGLLRTETVKCPVDNIIFVTWEPPIIKKYNRNFLNQFGKIITCHEDIKHNFLINEQQGLPWHIGVKNKDGVITGNGNSYDELKGIKEFNKNKLISVITSDKKFTKGHIKRYEFVEKLKAHFGDRLDVFGRGVRDIEDKWDAIGDYKYHIALENSQCKDYWTEKLSDSFLGGAYPLYYGCPNIHDYFPKESLTVIDIDDVEGTISKIESDIENNKYEKRIDNILEARNMILDKYNLFAMLGKHCTEKAGIHNDYITIRPESEFKKSILKRIFSKLKN